MGGTKVDALEEKSAEKCGMNHAITSTFGTAAIHPAIAALNLEPGNEIITVAVTRQGPELHRQGGASCSLLNHLTCGGSMTLNVWPMKSGSPSTTLSANRTRYCSGTS